MVRSRFAAAIRLFLCVATVSVLASGALAQTAPSAGLTWLNARQNANGTWGADPDFLPRDTSRVLIAQALLRASNANVTAGLAWLGSQRGFSANQFLAEQALALSHAKMDATPILNALASQRSVAGPDFGGFADHTGNSYDSALALQALATNEPAYATSIAGVVTTLITRQNGDGGWGIDQGFDSNIVMTAEVLVAFSVIRGQQAPPATIAAAQAYLARAMRADGSIGNGVLETAVSFRALALSGYPLSGTATATLNYLTARKLADGSWGSDAYLTARVLEAYAANKPNLTIKEGDLKLAPSEVAEGGEVTATIKVTNIGAASSTATNVTLYVNDSAGRNLGAVNVNALAAGASQTVTYKFAASQLTGTQTIYALVDTANSIDEMRDDDNHATAPLKVAGKPDLQVFSADVVTAPARLQPQQAGTITVTIRNNGEGEATSVGYAIYRGTGSSETLLKKDVIASIAAGGAQVVEVPVTLAAGTHAIRVVADPDAQIVEAIETNNQATKSISVAAAANIDLRITSGAVTTAPRLPSPGTAITIWAKVANGGAETAKSTVAFYDGVPGSGGVLIGSSPVTIAAGSSIDVPFNYTTRDESKVVYAVADPDNLVPELDEANNQSFALLTDAYADLVLTREGFVLPRGSLQGGQSLTSRLVVRNNGSDPVTGVQVVIYDDLPQNGGTAIVDKVVDVPAQGKVVVEAAWTVRAGQRFAAALVNPQRTIFEPDYSNNRVVKLYTANGNEGDIALNGARATSVDSSGLVVNTTSLTASGFVKLNLATPGTRAFTVTLFEDVDGDLAFHPEVDSALGSTVVQPGTNPQMVQIAAQGTVRFAPGKIAIHLDSSNAIAETSENNNLIDAWQDCQAATPNFKPAVKWKADRSVSLSPVARIIDTNGDDVVDENDSPVLVNATGGSIALHRGDTGERLWIKGFNFSGRQISPAIGDLDGDGKAEIVVHDYDHRLVALNAIDGSRKWTSDNLERDPTWDWMVYYVDYSYVGAPVIADLDGDGAVEVISGRTCLRGADGTVKWIGGGGAGRAWAGDNLYFENFPDQEAPIAADVNNDGKLEVVAGNTVYRADGTILWRRGDLPDGYTSPVYLGSEATPKICLVANGGIWMLNSDGSTLWGRVAIPGGALLGGAPTVFMDGNTGPWIGVAGDGYYSVLNATTGAVRWTKQTTDNFSFGITTTNSATAFDFGGGMMLAYASRSKMLLMRASDGAFMYEQPISALTFHPSSPVVADVDGDLRADLIMPGIPAMQVISDPTWRGAPAIFNQSSYHVVNVSNDRASIPRTEVQSAFSRTHYRSNVSQPLAPGGANPQPNLSASHMRVDTSGFPANLKLTVRAGNNGWTAAVPVKVGFYSISGTATTLVGTATSVALAPGEYEDVTFTFANPPTNVTSFHAVADSDLAITECNESDNRSPGANVKLTADVAIDASLTSVSDAQPNRGETIEFLAGAQISSAVDASRLTVQFFLGNPATGGTPISPALLPQIVSDAGNRIATVAFTWNVSAPAGAQTVHVVFDPSNAIAEDNETNNGATYALQIGSAVGQPDLQAFPTDIVLTPAQPQPNQPATLTVTVRNTGKGDATDVAYAVYDVSGSTQTLLTRGTIASLLLNSSQIASATITLAEGPHTIRVVVDPDNAVSESNETNNVATKVVDVSAVSNVDLIVTNVTATPARPAAGQSVSISATVTNGGSESVDSKVAFYDGVPGAGATLIKLFPITLAPQASVTLTATHTATADSKVVYAAADPDDVVNELDETNNAAYALLTDQYADLAVTRADISLASDNVSGGQSVVAQIVIRNNGPLAANGVQVVVYDDLAQSGGRQAVDTVIDVPAQGSVTVPATWAARAGQRFGTVVVNPSRSVFEPTFTNNTASRFYTASGDEADLSIVSIDTAALVVDPAKLSVSGDATLQLNAPGTKAFTVVVFEDVDGDSAYSPDADFSLGAALVQAGVETQTITIPVSGTLRFAPGKLMVYVDSTNAVSETDETNNLRDLWQLCTTPRANLTASYVRADTSGYPASAKFIVRVGNNGAATAVQSGVAFHAITAAGDVALGTATVPALAPGAYADVQVTVNNPNASTTGIYAIADGPSLINECSETDNRSETAAVQFSSDIEVDSALLLASDPQPRQGDAIQLTAVARLSGAVSAGNVTAQFFLGNPSVDGTPISSAILATRSSSRDTHSATVNYTWTVSAPVGPQPVYVVFDPANAVAEDDETNNRGIFSLNVTSPDPVRKLSGSITLDPPAGEPGTAVGIQILVKNIGNVALENLTLRYTVTGGPGTDLEGSKTVALLPKNGLALVALGQFKPSANGEYSVAVTPSDSAVTLISGAKAIRIAPFASAELTAAPHDVPVSLPLVQAHMKISRGNTIIVPDDPLVPLLKTHIQKGLNWQQPILNNTMQTNCFKCHVTAQGVVGLELSRGISGVNVDDDLAKRLFTNTLAAQNSHDSGYGDGRYDFLWPRTTVTLGSWSLTHWRDRDAAWPSIKRALVGVLRYQNSDGSSPCDECSISYGGKEAMTMMSVYSLGRGYETTREAKYRDGFLNAVRWLAGYNYNGVAPEHAARVSIGLSHALTLLTSPSFAEIADPSLESSIRKKIGGISVYLRSQQNPDGSFGTQALPETPVVRTAQSLYALSLAGVPGTDQSLRSAIVWLINAQQPNGGWREAKSDTNQIFWIDESTWAMIALPAAFLRLGQFDVDYDLLLPPSHELVSSIPAPHSAITVDGGKQLKWRFKDVTEQEQQLLLNLKLNGLEHNEQRAIAGRSALTYQHPYSGEQTTRDVAVPLVTGFAPLRLTIATDKPSYGPSSPVEITEVVENVGTTTVGITNSVVIRDANGATVATVAANDPVAGLPPDPFPGWNYAFPVTMPVERDGVNRMITFGVDFGQILAASGVSAEAFDPSSIRITADNAAATELFYSFNPTSAATPAAGRLFVTIPDSVPANSTLALHVYFDTVANGIKPVSMYDRTKTGTGAGQGFRARYYALDTAKQGGYVDLESQVKYFEPPLLTAVETNTYIGSTFPAGVQRDYFVAIWTGSFYAPVTGTYNFELGSDDGSWLSIDGVEIINNGGGHGPRNIYGSRQLTAGLHTFRVTMFEWGGGEYLTLRWAPPGQGYAPLPQSALFTDMPAAGETSIVVGTAKKLPRGTVTRKFVWNSGTTATGPYTAVGTLSQHGTFVADAAAPFSISPASQLTGTIATDKPAYDSGELVRVTAGAQYTGGNVTLTNLQAVVSVSDSSGAVKATNTTAIASLIPGQTATAKLEWPAGASAPGTYTATMVVTDAAGAVLVTRSVPFELRSSAQTGKGVTGTLAAPPSMYAGETVPFAVTVTNGGNTALTDAPFAVVVLDEATQSEVAAFDFTASIAAGATFTTDLTWPTTRQTPQKVYNAYLVSRITGAAVPLATTNVQILEPPYSKMTGSIAPARPAYECNEEVSVTASVLYGEGNVTRKNVTATATLLAPDGSVVDTRTVSAATFAVGQNLALTMSWPTATSAPGTYALTLVAKDANETYVDDSSSFEVLSNAVTGACITGTVATESPMRASYEVPLAATVTNSGNSALVDAPFSLLVVDPATDTVVTTFDFTASIAMGATFSIDRTWLTTRETPQKVYDVRLVSRITATAARLAATTVQIIEPPYSKMTGTVTSEHSTYDCNADVKITASVAYDEGNVTRKDVTATAALTAPDGTVLDTRTATAATFAVGENLALTMSWPTGTSVPGTYALTLVAKDANETYVDVSSSFEVLSNAVTGACISGTVATESPMRASYEVPLAATITNGGNSALVDAPFSILIVDPDTQSAVATFDFTASIAMGATFTTEHVWLTTRETPQKVYDVRLVSRITATAARLAATTVQIIEPPYSKMTGTVSSERATYDCNEDVKITASVAYGEGNVTRKDVTATATLTAPDGSVLDTRTATAATFAVGENLALTMSWPTATSVPGTYALTLVAKDANETYVDVSSSFEVLSNAVTGACLTGTVATESPMRASYEVPLAATITNSGNSALVDAPFSILIVDPATDTAVATFDFTASINMGATFSIDRTWLTTRETPQKVYDVRLVSRITATAARLAATTVQIIEPPYSKMTGAVTSERATYECNENVKITASVKYDEGNVSRNDVTATATLTAPDGTVLETRTSTEAKFVVGENLVITFNWDAATSAPGTYALTLVAKDANETYLETSSTFEIHSSAVTGACLTGSISAEATVITGDTLPFTVTLANGGNSALNAAPFSIVITNSSTQDVVATFPVEVTAAMGATFTYEVPWTAAVTPRFYRAQFMSLITGTAVPMAEMTVEVLQPPLELQLSQGAPPRVLIWADCANGNAPSTCTPAMPAVITTALTKAGIPWKLVGDQYTFLSELRTGAFDEAILYQKAPYEGKVFAEYGEIIRSGVGLLLVKAHPDAMPKLSAPLGVTFNGAFKATSTILELQSTPFTSPGQLTLNGDGVKLTLAGATAAAKVLATQAPAISHHTFGAGRVVVVPFDLEKTNTTDVAKLIVDSARYIARRQSFDARDVVAIDFKVTPPPGAPADLQIAALLPQGMTVVHAMPALSTTSSTSWNVRAEGEELHLYLWVRLPDAAGTYTITGTAAFAGQLAIVTKTLDVQVTADRAAMETSLHAALTALAQSAPAKDLKALQDAQAQLTAIRAANPTDSAGVVAVIGRVLTLISNLETVSADTTTARDVADRMLAWWQSRAGA